MRNAPVRHVLTVVAGLLLLAIAGPDLPAAQARAGAGAQRSSASPLSVMVQVSSLAPTATPATVGRWLDRFCRTDPGRPHELVLQDVASSQGALLTPYLDVITKRLPGGRRPCIDHAVVGTVQVPWAGPGSAYHDGVLDPTYQNRVLSLSASTARAFVQRYGTIRFDWYLTLEANLNEMYYDDVADAYRTLLGAELTSLAQIRHRPVMWSPAFWYPYSTYRHNTAGMETLRTHAKDLIAALAPSGLSRIDLQDYVGGSSCQPDWNRSQPEDAVGWIGFLRSLGTATDIRVNAERFVPDCLAGALSATPRSTIVEREQFYASHGVPLGATFELRYWVAEFAPKLLV